MSTTGDQNPTRESRDNPVTLEGEWVLETAGSDTVGLSGSSATPEAEEIVVDCPRKVEDIGPEGNPEEEGNREESVDIEENTDIEAVDEEEEDEEEEEEESVPANENVVVDAHFFPMAGFRFMLLDLVRAIRNRVYYDDHILVSDPREDQEMDPPDTFESSNSNELQVPPGPIPSTVRPSEYEQQGSDLPEIISTFPELEEPTDFEEAADHYLHEPEARAAGQAIEELGEEPAGEIMERSLASGGGNYHARQYEDDCVVGEEEEKEEEKKNEEALDEMHPEAADYCTNKFS